MRILLDTNVLIPLEDTKVLDAGIATLTQLAYKYRCTLLCHPSSIKDIERDRNKDRQDLILSKVRKYDLLDPPGEQDKDFLALIPKPKKPNDVIDNDMLYAVFRHSVNFLVTEDRDIHKKAQSLGIDSRVYTIEQCVEALRGLYDKKPVAIPNVQEIPVYKLSSKDPFFGSLATDYRDFDKWFQKICEEGRKAWAVLKDDGTLGAVLIIKEEVNDGIIPIPAKKILKMCTFKVGEHLRGRKVGELLLKACFAYCLDNGYQGTYLTAMPHKQTELLSLCFDFGFQQAPYNDKEVALYKSFLPPDEQTQLETEPFEFHVRHYPYYKVAPDVGKFIVPVIPQYHKVLFPDGQKQTELFYPNESVNNGILKAYICNSNNNKVKRGDLILFYRSQDWKAVTTLGIVETVLRTEDSNEVAAAVSKRTVYSFDQIQDICNKSALVILFRQIKHLSNHISFHTLRNQKIISNRLETITAIENDKFRAIVK